MIKRLTREVVEMTIVALVMFLIASIVKFIGAGGRELIVSRVVIVAMTYIAVNMIVGKRA